MRFTDVTSDIANGNARNIAFYKFIFAFYFQMTTKSIVFIRFAMWIYGQVFD